MIVHGIRCDTCKKDYPATSAASVEDIRKEAKGHGWSVGLPPQALMTRMELLQFKASGVRRRTVDQCPGCQAKSDRESIEKINKAFIGFSQRTGMKLK